MRYPLNPLLLAAVLVLSACGASRPQPLPAPPSPPAVDLIDLAEPAPPGDAELGGPDGEAAADAYDDAVLIWGRTLRLQVARLRQWFEDNRPR